LLVLVVEALLVSLVDEVVVGFVFVVDVVLV
jgi:hypothetical protein